MPYATTNPPVLMAPRLGASVSAIWVYVSIDIPGDVDAAGYFTNGDDLGMKVNDVVICIDSDTGPTIDVMVVSAVTAGGAATVINGT